MSEHDMNDLNETTSGDLPHDADEKPVLEELVLVLKKPVTLDKEYTEIHLKEPNSRQISAALAAAKKGSEADYIIFLTAAVSGMPLRAAQMLCQRDFKAASDFFAQLE